MDQKEFFLKHWQKEAAATGKVISRVPEGSTYKPDPKARTAREIAWLIVREEAALVEGLERGVFEWTEVPAPANVKDVIAQYEREHDALTKRLQAIPSSRWEEQLPFMWGGQE
jgi:uncharacterized damage-inducible protein DinB